MCCQFVGVTGKARPDQTNGYKSMIIYRKDRVDSFQQTILRCFTHTVNAKIDLRNMIFTIKFRFKNNKILTAGQIKQTSPGLKRTRS